MYKNRSEASLNLLFQLHKHKSDTLWLYKALTIEQQAKSPVLREAKQWQQRLLEVTDTSLAKELKQIQLAVANAGNELRQVSMGLVKNPTLIQQLQNQYTLAIDRQRNLLIHFENKHPKLSATPSFTSEILKQKNLLKGETFVSYFIGNESLFQFVITKDNVSFNKLVSSSKELNELLHYIKEYNSFFENASKISNDPLTYTQAAHKLYKALQLPKTERLVVIPDGLLSFVPFNALLTQPSTSISFKNMPFLIKNTEISYALSLADYMQETEAHNFKKVLGVFPIFKGTTRELKYSLDEATAVEKMTKADLLLENEATSINFLTQMNDYDILHISSHAQGGTFNQLAGIEFTDKSLNINELYGYQFNKSLVVLSACETGIGRLVKGEGAQSVARAFQYTGAKNVLFSLWKVNDLSTAQLMQNFYNRLGSTTSKSHSLHQAQLDYLNAPKIDNSKKSPFYWAAFVYYGEAEIKSQTNNMMLLWISLPMLLILGLWLKYGQQKKRNV